MVYVAPVLFLLAGCRSVEEQKALVRDSQYYHAAQKSLTDVIVRDIFSPPVASRIYAYPSIASHEVLCWAEPALGLRSLAFRLRGLTPAPPPHEDISFELAAIHAFFEVGKDLIYSREILVARRQELYQTLRDQGVGRRIFERSTRYGELVAGHILRWASQDQYRQTRNLPKYTVLDSLHLWKPTAPDYLEGIEPHWGKIRPMVMDSSNQFPPVRPATVDLKPNSPFYQQLTDVWQAQYNLTKDQTEIAKFWDCNPYVSHHHGHAMFAVKKITPGGHWMNIATLAARHARISFAQSARVHALVSITLFDGFISCWEEKWRSVLVRPETLVHSYLDAQWTPLLQTPPFPEYTSGHSVISRAAAEVLTELFGENFAYTDTSEMEYGLPARRFESFVSASQEAALSRFYGGIHYMMAVDQGLDQGKKVGMLIKKRLLEVDPEGGKEPAAGRGSDSQ